MSSLWSRWAATLQRLLPNVHTPAHAQKGLVLALGGGGARGLAHIGVLQVLQENQIPVRAIAGTSIGAEIGAFYASGMSIDKLTHIAIDFDWIETLQLFMPDLPGGGITSGKNIVEFLDSHLGTFHIEDLPLPYVAIATDMQSGEQVIFDRGRLVDAVRASISMPGFMMPYSLEDKYLIDGGVVNPLPFDVARQRFGGPVVAVAVNAASQQRVPFKPDSSQWPSRIEQLLQQPWMERIPALRDWLKEHINHQQKKQNSKSNWTVRKVLDRAGDITQNQLVSLRSELHPADLILTPDVSSIGVLEFYEAAEAIAAGRTAALEQLPRLKQLASSQC